MKLLIVGVATDGPLNSPIQSKDERTFKNLFGDGYTERFSITPTASSVSLSFTPWLLPQNTLNGIAAQVFAPSINGNVYTFGSVGGTGSTLDLTYTPYLGKGDLIFAGRKFIEQTSSMPYVCRAGGSYATVSTQGYLFQSVYPGTKYNNLTVSYTGSSLTYSGLEPNYPTLTYLGDWDTIKVAADADFLMGLSPIQIANIGSTSLTAFTLPLTGGLSGTLTDSDVQDFLDQADIPADVTHILVLAPLSSGTVQTVTNYLQTVKQPRMFLFPAPSYVDPTSGWCVTQNTNIPYRSNMIASFVGEVVTTLDSQRTSRYFAEEACIAFTKEQAFNLTNIHVDAVDFSPTLSESDLDLVVSNGWIPPMRYIENDISVYQGVTSLNQNTFLFSSKYAEIMAIAYNYLFPYFGTVLRDGEQPKLSEELLTLLGEVNYINIQNVDITKLGDAMYVQIDAILAYEILSIKFTVRNN